MPTIRILNWNIQQFGKAKSGIKWGNQDVVDAIARVVVGINCDIFVMLEMNTTKNATAVNLCNVMLVALQNASGVAGHWQQVLLSPNTGREFYAYFVRNTAVTPAAPATGTALGGGPPPLLGGGGVAVVDARFTVTAAGGIHQGAPLFEPDSFTDWGNPPQVNLGVLNWPGTRRPAFGLFQVVGAAAANAYVPIIACHYVPSSFAATQFGTLPFFSFFRNLGPNTAGVAVAPAPLTLTVNGAGYVSNYYVHLGDFNIEFIAKNASYAPIIGNNPGQLGAVSTTPVKTELIRYQKFNEIRPSNLVELRYLALDNLFVRQNPAVGGVTIANAGFVDIPQLIWDKTLTLNASVSRAEELDQRGFKSGEFKPFILDFAKMLGPHGKPNLKGTLLGSRVISDHVPVWVDLTV